MQTARKYSNKANRNPMLAAIHIEWLKIRPDLKHDKEALREERLIWVSELLGYKHTISSMSLLSDKQLGIVLDELRKLTKPKTSTQWCGKLKPATNTSAEIIHLANEAQVLTLQKIISFLQWSDDKLEGFLVKRYRSKSLRMLTFKQANSATFIFLNIAADADLRKLGFTKITREQTNKHIPEIKRRLEIDGMQWKERGVKNDSEKK